MINHTCLRRSFDLETVEAALFRTVTEALGGFGAALGLIAGVCASLNVFALLLLCAKNNAVILTVICQMHRPSYEIKGSSQ
jgi:hypothetical protein